MTKTFEYTLKHIVKNEGVENPRSENDFHVETITLRKKVTDRMEERNSWKVAYACEYFNNILRTQYGRKRAEANARNVKEV